MRIVHAADLHLDSPMRGLERYPGAPAPALRDATRRALIALVDLCLHERAALLLIAGDLYDDDWRDYSTGLFFDAQMQRLREVGARVVIVRGNHDAASVVTRHLRLPEHVRVLATSAPESYFLEDIGVVIHGQSFAHRAVTDDLAAQYPEALPGLLNVGLLHTSADGRPGHERYAPTSLATLSSKGYAYWALGHVHTREVLSTHPWVIFPGNPQGRHARETGPKGATLIDVADDRIVSVEPRILDAARWSVVTETLEARDSFEDALSKIEQSLLRRATKQGTVL